MGLFNAIGSLIKNTAMLPVDATRDVIQTVLDDAHGPSKTGERLDRVEVDFLDELDDDETL